MGIAFEWTVKFGDVLTLFGAFAVGAAFLYRRGGQDVSVNLTLKALTSELTEMKTEFKTFGETLQRVAVQEMQINLLMKWYDELRRGVGFIKGARGVDREYPDGE